MPPAPVLSLQMLLFDSIEFLLSLATTYSQRAQQTAIQFWEVFFPLKLLDKLTGYSFGKSIMYLEKVKQIALKMFKNHLR